MDDGWPKHDCQLYYNIRAELSVENGLLLRKDRIAIFMSASLGPEIIQLHEGHLGMEKCKRRARTSVYWPGINADIDKMVSNCKTCLKQAWSRLEAKQPKRAYDTHRLTTGTMAEIWDQSAPPEWEILPAGDRLLSRDGTASQHVSNLCYRTHEVNFHETSDSSDCLQLKWTIFRCKEFQHFAFMTSNMWLQVPWTHSRNTETLSNSCRRNH